MSGSDTPLVYISMVVATAVLLGIGCFAARSRPGSWTTMVARGLAVVLLAKGALWIFTAVDPGPWSVRTGLPLYLCDISVFIAAAACWWRIPLLVELTYFWGLAGVLQAIVTPELPNGFPHLLFIQYTVGHLAVVSAAVYLTVGLRIAPRPGATVRVFAITVGYTAAVGILDWITGANYMLLRHRPPTWSLLSIMGHWPWYILGATGLAVLFFTLLDAPFWASRRRARLDASEESGDYEVADEKADYKVR